MNNITIGMKIKSKLRSSIAGEVIKLFEDGTAIIMLEGNNLQVKQMAVCLKYWDVV